MTYMLGKLPHVHDDRTLQLAKYVTKGALPEIPPAIDYSPHVQTWPMYGNDAIGDCTCAAAGHMIQLWTAMRSVRSKPTTLSLRTIEKLYGKVTGWPEAGDNGANELDILSEWRKNGLTKTHKLWAFAQVDQHDHAMVKAATYLFGGLYIGFGISDPTQLFNEFDHRVPWTPERGQVTEGHAVPLVGFDAVGPVCVSWARVQRMTWEFWDELVDEAWVCLPAEWKTRTGIPGIDFDQLAIDLQSVAKAA